MKNSERKKQNVLSSIDKDRALAKAAENPHAEQIGRLQLQKETLTTERNEITKYLENANNGSADNRRAKRIRKRKISSELRNIGIQIDLLQT